jgi:hypothetical protein
MASVLFKKNSVKYSASYLVNQFMQLYTRMQSIFSILQWLKNLVRSEKTFTNQKKIITIQSIKNQFNDIYFDAIDTADYQLMGI